MPETIRPLPRGEYTHIPIEDLRFTWLGWGSGKVNISFLTKQDAIDDFFKAEIPKAQGRPDPYYVDASGDLVVVRVVVSDTDIVTTDFTLAPLPFFQANIPNLAIDRLIIGSDPDLTYHEPFGKQITIAKATGLDRIPGAPKQLVEVKADVDHIEVAPDDRATVFRYLGA